MGESVRFWRSRWFKKLFGIKPKVPTNIIIAEGDAEDRTTSQPTSPKEPHFHELWRTLEIDPHRIEEVRRICGIIDRNRLRYHLALRKMLDSGRPTPDGLRWLLACLHYRESSLSFRGVLHNGDRIIGTGKKTKHVPKGRGPFSSWEDSAVDALEMKNYHNYTDWSIATCLRRAEQYNGMGYRYRIGNNGRKEYTPYVWAGSNHHDENSKYTHDGRYDPYAPEKQLGVAVIAKGLKDFYGWRLS